MSTFTAQEYGLRDVPVRGKRLRTFAAGPAGWFSLGLAGAVAAALAIYVLVLQPLRSDVARLRNENRQQVARVDQTRQEADALLRSQSVPPGCTRPQLQAKVAERQRPASQQLQREKRQLFVRLQHARRWLPPHRGSPPQALGRISSSLARWRQPCCSR